MEETYPPPSSTGPYPTAPNSGSTPAQEGHNHEMQNQTHPQGEAAGYYNNVGYGKEGQQQPQQGEQDNKKKAIELAKKGWAMYKKNKK